MVGRQAQGQGPHRGADAVEQQVAARWVAGQADSHRHHRTQAVDETETQYPDIRMAADVLQRPVTHGLPARLAGKDLAPVAAAHEVPQLVAGVTAAEGHQDHQLDVHVFAERKKAREHQDGLALEERAEKKGKVAEIVQELLKHFLACWRNERAAYPFRRAGESVQMCLDVKIPCNDNGCGHKSQGCLRM
ncbi:hypothetical protein PRtIB026_A03940 [Pseudomonas sp. RtIB026]|nr:hypothetical protein PRtIB026_A03940 [Pseudomonas sp. RtIB026]